MFGPIESRQWYIWKHPWSTTSQREWRLMPSWEPLDWDLGRWVDGEGTGGTIPIITELFGWKMMVYPCKNPEFVGHSSNVFCGIDICWLRPTDLPHDFPSWGTKRCPPHEPMQISLALWQVPLIWDDLATFTKLSPLFGCKKTLRVARFSLEFPWNGSSDKRATFSSGTVNDGFWTAFHASATSSEGGALELPVEKLRMEMGHCSWTIG